mgnify:CR=1 FL=1
MTLLSFHNRFVMNPISSVYSTNVSPKSWVTVGHHMIRLRTWGLTYGQILDAVQSFISDGWFKLAVRTDADGVPSGYSALLLECESDMDRIRENRLVALVPNPLNSQAGSACRPVDPAGEPAGYSGRHVVAPITKIPKFVLPPGYDSCTIKTTAPLWATKDMFKEIFSRYSSDLEKYSMTIDGKYYESEQYPIVRTYPLHVTRHGEKVLANVVYIEYSPKPGHEDDALVAQSMQHRTKVVDPNDPTQCANLIFNFWIIDKTEAKISLQDRKRVHEERVRQKGVSGSDRREAGEAKGVHGSDRREAGEAKSLDFRPIESTVSSKSTGNKETRIVSLGFPSPFEIPLLKCD